MAGTGPARTFTQVRRLRSVFQRGCVVNSPYSPSIRYSAFSSRRFWIAVLSVGGFRSFRRSFRVTAMIYHRASTSVERPESLPLLQYYELVRHFCGVYLPTRRTSKIMRGRECALGSADEKRHRLLATRHWSSVRTK